MSTAPPAAPTAPPAAKSSSWPSRARLIWAALGWSALVWGGMAAITHHDLQRWREDLHEDASRRLQAVQAAVQISLQQMAGIPRVVATLESSHALLRHLDPLRDLSPQALRQDEQVVHHSIVLYELASEAGLDNLWLVDPQGRVVADNRYASARPSLGQLVRDRSFFNETASTGQSLRVDNVGLSDTPVLVFAARVGEADGWTGQVIATLSPTTLQHLLADPQRRLLITDARGQVIALAGGTAQDGPAATALVWRGRVPMQADASPTVSEGDADRPLPWQVHPTSVGGQRAWEVSIDGLTYLADSAPLSQAGLTAWSLSPLHGQADLISTRAVQAGLLWALGLGLLILLDQRGQRLRSLMALQQELANLAHALPLSVFRYEQPLDGPGRFTFLSEDAGALLGLNQTALRQNPTLAWGLMGVDGTVSGGAGPIDTHLPPTVSVEFPVQRDGRIAWIACNSRMVERGSGRRTYNGFWTDITLRKEVEARTQAVFRHAPLAFMFYRPEDGVLRCNPRAVELFGAQADADLLGQRLFGEPLSRTEQADAARSAIAETQQDRQTRTFEWHFQTLQGQPFDAEVVLIAFEYGGQVQYCALMQDVTVRKQADATMRQAQLASQAAAETKSRFLANMSHEIRTPMNAILGMTHLALLETLPDKARNYVDKAHRAADNLLQILNDVLDVSKIESGKMVLEYTDFQLEQVISHMADVLGMRAEDKGLELLFTAPPELPTALIGDPIRLGQVLINLGTNAIKFTEHGEVLIGCEVEAQHDDEVQLHFWVRDTGIGMAPDQIERLFQPFTQADTSTTRQYGGTGLGLTICRELVQLMHGRIWADSQPGRGSTFHFSVRMGVQTKGSARRALLAEELRDKRLLLVDDNATARDVLGTMASRLGLQVDTCGSGPQALQRMQEAMAAGQPHHVLLTDWKMPGMDGIAFARHALSLPPEQLPCVLLVTAFARDEALRAADGVGLAGVLNKPVTPSTLLDTLSRALGREGEAPVSNSQTSRVLQAAQRQLAGARVLLVEDQPMNQELARDLLERAGLKVVTASHGAEALDKLDHDGPFDGVLMDCQMPVMDGYTAAERIRARSDWQSLPVIAMTASAMASDRERVLASGMNDHITKPLDLGQMFTIMARWIVPRAQHLSQPGAMSPLPNVGDLAPESPQAALSSVTSLDTVDGLSRCMGNMALYQRLLKGFAKTQHDFAEQLAAATDRESALRVVHTLKGLAGNIGATGLHQASSQLEAHMHSSTADDPADLRAEIQHPLALTLEALQSVLADIQRLNAPRQAIVSHQRIELDDPALQARFDTLQGLIADHDARAREQALELAAHASALQGHPLMQQLQRAVERYDFDEAAVALSALRRPNA